MKTIHKVKIKKDKHNALAINHPKRRKTTITIYLEPFNFRKNVSYKKVAKTLNYYFLSELICSLSRELNNKWDPLCGWDYEKYTLGCPCDKCMKFMGFR